MKNWKKAGIGALCVMSLLAGCGMQGGKDDGNGGKDDTPMDVTLETLREVNDPCMLLAKYDAVTVNIQGTDRDGEVAYTARLQYTDGGDSTILMSSHYSYTANSGPGEDELWSEGCGRLYATRMASDDNASLNIYPIPGEGTEYLLDILPQCADPAAKNAEETLDERSEQDGAVVISTTTTYNDMPDYYFTTLYYVDPATGELLAKSVTDYSKDESGEASVLGTTLYDWSYGESYLPDKELAAEAFNSDEVCALTLVYNPGAADEETQEISIKRGTYVTFVSSTGNLLYADAALTQPIDDTVSIDTNGEEMTVYVVPDVPLN